MLEADSASSRFDPADIIAWPVPCSAADGRVIASAGPWERSGYRPGGAARLPAVAGAALAVAGMLAAFLFMNVAPRPRAQPELVVMRLTTTPPPPRPAPALQPKRATARPATHRIVAPPPVVALPAPSAAAVAAPAPVIAPPVPASAPAPVVAPAPPTPADGGDLSAKMIFAKPPAYPLESRRRHEQGTVVLDLTLSANGTVQDITVARSSGFDRLDQAALAAVRRWRWAPVTRDGAPVMVRGQVTIPFVLKG